MPLRLALKTRYGHAFPLAVPGRHIARFCAPQPVRTEVPDDTQIGGSARGYPRGFTSLAVRLCPSAIGPDLYFYAAPPLG